MEEYNWIEEKEMLDLTAIAQSSPGAIAATIGCVLPACIIVLILAYIYYKYRGLSTVQAVLNGLRQAVIAMSMLSSKIRALYPSFYDLIFKRPYN